MNIKSIKQFVLLCSCPCKSEVTGWVHAESELIALPELVEQAKMFGAIFYGGKYFIDEKCVEDYKSNKRLKNEIS